MKTGKVIVLEGLDKSGKTTQSQLLFNYLSKKDPGKVELLNFPDYSTRIGREIRAFLDGQVQYNNETKHMLLSANRWEKKLQIEESVKSGKTIIMNRYYQSNIVYGLANGLAFEWLLNLDEGLPKEDFTIILDINPQISHERSFENNFILDEFEKNKAFLNRARMNYIELAKKFNWKVLSSDIKKEDLFKLILNILEE